jgi:hypothetical protein
VASEDAFFIVFSLKCSKDDIKCVFLLCREAPFWMPSNSLVFGLFSLVP